MTDMITRLGRRRPKEVFLNSRTLTDETEKTGGFGPSIVPILVSAVPVRAKTKGQSAESRVSLAATGLRSRPALEEIRDVPLYHSPIAKRVQGQRDMDMLNSIICPVLL